MRLRDLKGLGPKSEAQLNEIGIYTKEDLQTIGPVNAFIKLCKTAKIRPSLNFLYAMIGALENRHWQEVVKTDKERLLMELEDYKELTKRIL